MGKNTKPRGSNPPSKPEKPSEPEAIEATIEDAVYLPLAFDAEGEPFSVDKRATCWRVRRMPGDTPNAAGRPEVLYSGAGIPLHVPLDLTLADLAGHVEKPALYRLDQCDADCQLIQARTAYVRVVETADDKKADAKLGPVHKLIREHGLTLRALTDAIAKKDAVISDTIQQQNKILARLFGLKLDAVAPEEKDDDQADETGAFNQFLKGAMPGLGKVLAEHLGPQIAQAAKKMFNGKAETKQIADGTPKPSTTDGAKEN